MIINGNSNASVETGLSAKQLLSLENARMNPILPVLPDIPKKNDARRLTQFLIAQGTFQFPQLPNGLFSAAAGQGEDFEQSGYRFVWVRDNMHIAHAHWLIGETQVAARTVGAVLQFFSKHRFRFENILSGRASPADPMERPHIRFDGQTLTEVDEIWAHAQNDALGMWLWMASKLIQAGQLPVDHGGWNVLCDLVHFFQAIQFWQDEDSGHWEEIRKIAASSIGVATAGLSEFRRLLNENNAARSAAAQAQRPVDLPLIDSLIARGRQALTEILPAECVQTDSAKNRAHDAAVLFLVYPCEIMDIQLATSIVADVVKHLSGSHGIRRYRGDSYWCANYKQLLSADVRTGDFSDSMADRDSLLYYGEEAQWCLFDPIVSAIFGLWHAKTGNPEFRARQLHHLRRSLAQLTPADSPHGPFRCPESYYLNGRCYVPNDMTPLLWTQANLRVALHWLEQASAGE
jgi:phosphorylase kinase alpha/beta subunit